MFFSEAFIYISSLRQAIAQLEGWKAEIGDDRYKFAECARENSLCADTADKGGLLLPIFRGQLAPQLEDVIFNEPIGKCYGPIATKQAAALPSAARESAPRVNPRDNTRVGAFLREPYHIIMATSNSPLLCPRVNPRDNPRLDAFLREPSFVASFAFRHGHL